MLYKVVYEVSVTNIRNVGSLTEKTFAEIDEDRWKQACHVEKMIDQLKATDFYTGDQGEHLVIYVPGSDDSRIDKAEEGSCTTQRVNQRRFTESIIFFEMINCLKCM